MEKSVNKLLNDTDLARTHLALVKEKLHRTVLLEVDDAALPSFVPSAVPTRSVCLVRSLEALRSPRRAMAQLQARPALTARLYVPSVRPSPVVVLAALGRR
jgi:hypothetical protein